MRVELIQAGSINALQSKINTTIEEVASSGDTVQDVELEVKPEDEQNATSFIAVLYVLEWNGGMV